MTFNREGARIDYRAKIILDNFGKGFGGNATYDQGELHIEAYISSFPGHTQRGVRISYKGELVYDVVDGVVKASSVGDEWGPMIIELFDEAYVKKQKRDANMPWINPYRSQPKIQEKPERELTTVA